MIAALDAICRTAAVAFNPKDRDLVGEMAEDFNIATESNAASGSEASTVRLFGQLELCPLEAMVMDVLKRRYAREFRVLHEAAELAVAVPEPFIDRIAREMRWYFRFVDLMKRMQTKGCPFVYPTISADGRIQLDGAYDLALALKKEECVVPNDLFIAAEERGVIVTGANQAGNTNPKHSFVVAADLFAPGGVASLLEIALLFLRFGSWPGTKISRRFGRNNISYRYKTTFLRSIGQIAALTALGLPVPCVRANLPLYQSIFCHFSEAEDSSTDHGKLKEELLRLKPALLSADRDSLVLLNEPFSSTTAQDAMDIADRALSMLVGAGARVLCVTHISGLESDKLVTMAAQIDPVSHKRLYRIVRAPAETHTYADEIARKYRLTYQEIKERVEHGI